MPTLRALVTGSDGFIGRHVVSRLVEGGWQVSGADIKKDIDIRIYAWHEKYDVIFHLAANASIPQSLNNPLESHSHNVVGTLRLLEYAKATGARIVFSSSSSVYGEPEITPTSEDAPAHPVIPYGLQKLECEQYMWLYHKLYGVNSVALRYFNVFGEGQERANGGGDSSLALANFLRQYKNDEPFTVVGDGQQRRDFVYVKDVAEANVAAAKFILEHDGFEVFNIGSGVNHSILEVTDMIKFLYPRTFLSPRVEPKVGLADISKAKELLSFSPTMRLSEWIKAQT